MNGQEDKGKDLSDYVRLSPTELDTLRNRRAGFQESSFNASVWGAGAGF